MQKTSTELQQEVSVKEREIVNLRKTMEEHVQLKDDNKIISNLSNRIVRTSDALRRVMCVWYYVGQA